MAGRPRTYSSKIEARCAANVRNRDTLVARGMVQRSVWLPRVAWETLRELRTEDESSDAATLTRLIQLAVKE